MVFQVAEEISNRGSKMVPVHVQGPKHNPRRLRDVDRRRIIRIREDLQRQSFAQIGVTAIKWELNKANLPIPSDRTINRILRQEGLVKKNSLYSERG